MSLPSGSPVGFSERTIELSGRAAVAAYAICSIGFYITEIEMVGVDA